MDYYGSLPVGGQGGQTRQPRPGVPDQLPLVRELSLGNGALSCSPEN